MGKARWEDSHPMATGQDTPYLGQNRYDGHDDDAAAAPERRLIYTRAPTLLRRSL